ncbi:hypothetical protein BS47DRAFT_1403270 [Hydnum rufescens UP504]|uniref:Uncharacterized protein n=1 Tax=Hydnum rufescens UP504 TaxID=1448309 RepID=A0A9P6AA77_9AGAM|nr:hypothetical protein BS47DRAFT_1403270 [Hydnum rufescens UP504]
MNQPTSHSKFSREGVLKHLIQWIAADDQSLNVVECVEFRCLLLYFRETLEEDDIPGRMKIHESIIKTWREEFEILKKDMKDFLHGGYLV